MRTSMFPNAYFDKDGFVVETSLDVIEGVPKITGISCDEVVLYEQLALEDNDVLRDLLSLTQMLKKYNLQPDKIHFGDDSDIVLYYGTVEVLVGTEENLSQKIIRLQKILPQLNGLSGTLHLENYDGTQSRLIFSKNEK